MNILILSCGTRNKIVQYFKKQLDGKGQVFATDCSVLAPALYDADRMLVEKMWQLPAFVGYTLRIREPLDGEIVLSETLWIPKIMQKVQPPGEGGKDIVEGHKVRFCVPLATKFAKGIIEWEIVGTQSGGKIAYERVEKWQPVWKKGWLMWPFPQWNGIREIAKWIWPDLENSLELYKPDEYMVEYPEKMIMERMQIFGNTRRRYSLTGYG